MELLVASPVGFVLNNNYAAWMKSLKHDINSSCFSCENPFVAILCVKTYVLQEQL